MGHYYAKDGTAMHYCGPNGSETTLREARKLGLLPSVTEVLNVLAKHALDRWKVNQAILAALTLPKIDGESEESYLRRIDADGRRQAQEAAQAGTSIHQAIEDGFASRTVPVAYRAHWQAVQRMLSDNYPIVTDWVSEKRFAHPAGFGGCSDLHSPSTGVVIDFKGSAITSKVDKRLAYDQFEQLAAYQWGLGLPRAPCANIFLARDEPGYAVFHQWTVEDIEHGLATFKCALELWQLRKRYRP
jgi:hypothetical protein